AHDHGRLESCTRGLETRGDPVRSPATATVARACSRSRPDTRPIKPRSLVQPVTEQAPRRSAKGRTHLRELQCPEAVSDRSDELGIHLALFPAVIIMQINKSGEQGARWDRRKVLHWGSIVKPR